MPVEADLGPRIVQHSGMKALYKKRAFALRVTPRTPIGIELTDPLPGKLPRAFLQLKEYHCKEI